MPPWRDLGPLARARVPLGTAARRTFATAAETNFYEVLQVPRHASKAQIKNQFYRLSKQYHPDATGDEESKEAFQRVSEAYATLGNDEKRRHYDQQLGRSSAAGVAGFRAPRSGAPPPSASDTYAHAHYAWAHQQRTHARTHTGAPRYNASARAADASGAGVGADATRLWATMTERAARLDEARMRSASSGAVHTHQRDTFRAWSQKRWSEEEHRAHMSSTAGRFLQVGAMFGITAWIGLRFFT